MTLLEILVAFTILAAIVVILVTSLRVGVRAWESGERQAAARQEVRAVIELITDALAAAYPYRARLEVGPQRVLLFLGEPEDVRFVTTAPPLALDVPAAPFHAVTLRRAGERELRLVERLLPAEEPFPDSPAIVLTGSVTAFRLQYRDEQGAWLDSWDGKTTSKLPSAVRVELTLRGRDQAERAAAFVVPIALGGAPI